MQGIDWGPDPEPAFSILSNLGQSNVNKSRQFSREGISMGSIPMLDSSILDNKAEDFEPYKNLIDVQMKPLKPLPGKMPEEPHTA